ncbi:MAG TPA: protein arginine kinase [Rhabdochlamydiaceae bacterium]|jgi:protein arginine kinase|nr:protein arginine kinase [Rhabdochlamydiaceae bacterium]
MSALPPSLFDHTLWEEDKNPIWLGSSLLLQRNFARYKFPPKLSETDMIKISTLLSEILLKNVKGSNYFSADKLSPLDKEFIFEHFLCLESFQNVAKGQGFLFDGLFLAGLNLKNHLQLQLIDTSPDLLTAWSQLIKLETEIGKTLDYAFSPKFGYLTSDPTLCGTALQAFLYLHVPALHHTGQLHEILGKQTEDDITTMGLEGALNDLVGDFLILKNRYTLGVTEESLLHALQITALKLSSAEKTLRIHLKESGNSDIKDLISRAYGLLVHSYQLQTKEALNALSLIKLGLDLGWISGTTGQALNTLFFKSRRAHLAYLLNEKTLDSHDTPRKRAEFIHKALQGLSLRE